MEIGDTVYVVQGSTGTSIAAIEVEVMSQAKKSAGYMGMVFQGKPLKRFTWKDGWQQDPEQKVYRYRINKAYSSKETALEALRKTHALILASSEQYCVWAKDSLIKAEANLKHCQETLDKVRKLDLNSLFNAGTEKYVSIFTGNEL